jgi:hypothetical protein
MLLKRKDYFDFTLKQVKHTSDLHGDHVKRDKCCIRAK